MKSLYKNRKFGEAVSRYLFSKVSKILAYRRFSIVSTGDPLVNYGEILTTWFESMKE